jgi:hypothetical protein
VSAEHRERRRPLRELRRLSSDELKALAEEAAALGIGETRTPRIFVSLASSTGGREPRQVTLGPYLNAYVTTSESGKTTLEATPNEDGSASPIVLASWSGKAWLLHDGGEDSGAVYNAIWFRTFAPPPLPGSG